MARLAPYGRQPTGRDRIIFVGKTGSGKTYLARMLVSQLDRVIVIDPKGSIKDKADWGLDEWSPEVEKDIMSGAAVRARYTTDPETDDYQAAYEEIFRLAFQAKNIVVYIDELYGVIREGGRGGKWLRNLYTQGRELNVGTWGATQRPSWVPLFCISECEFFWVFRLQLAKDRARMAEIMGEKVMIEIDRRDKYGFWFYSMDEIEPSYHPVVIDSSASGN